MPGGERLRGEGEMKFAGIRFDEGVYMMQVVVVCSIQVIRNIVIWVSNLCSCITKE